MKAIAADPVQMKALGSTSSGLENLLSMTGEIPGGDKIKEAFLRGGIPGMMDLFNKVVSGKLSAEDLLAAMDTETTEEKSFTAMMVSSGTDSKKLQSWSDYDTAGVGDKPSTSDTEVASTDKTDTTTQPSDSKDTTTKPSDDTAQVGRPGEKPPEEDATASNSNSNSNQQMTRSEAIKRMIAMLQKMANKKK
jgi:hypothetical protein